MSWATGLILICLVLIAIWIGAEVRAVLEMRRSQRKRDAYRRYCEAIDAQAAALTARINRA